MDVQRKPQKNFARNASIIIAAGTLVTALVLTGLRTSMPSVERGSIVIDSVKRGDILRQVRAPGNLIPEHIRWITAQTSARVERLVAQSGQTVVAGELLLELSNPDLQIQAMQADQQVRQAEIASMNLRSGLNGQRMSQEAVLASLKTSYLSAHQNDLEADVLLKERLIANTEAANRKALAMEMSARLTIEERRLAMLNESIPQQLSAQSAQVEQLRTIAAHQQARFASLQVRATEAGVLQDLAVQPGQWVPEGSTLAKVVQPGKLKAVLRVAESQAKDVQLGQNAVIDTRNGVIRGHVARKDPGSQSGTVTVDVALDGPLPAGAVPDISVDGTVEVEKLTNVLYTGRPAFGPATGPIGLFKLVEGGTRADRVSVILGRSSANVIEIVRGLSVGDQVILSDMSPYDGSQRIGVR